MKSPWMNGRAFRGPVRALLLVTLGVCCLLPSGTARGDVLQGHSFTERKKKQQGEAPQFSSSDFLRLCLDPPAKNTFVLGEPVPVNMRLANHTRFIVDVQLNLDYREGLNISIRGERTPPRRYNGPHETGGHLPIEMSLYPYEERPLQFIVWGDRDAKTGLAFPEPGQYAMEIKVKVLIPEISIAADIVPLDPITLLPAKPRVVQITPPAPEIKPLIEFLIGKQVCPELHLGHLPGGDLETYTQLITNHPATPISPYLTFALGSHYNFLSRTKPEDGSLRDMASQYLQMTALADSAVKAEAWSQLLGLYDRWGLAGPAREAALNYIKASPPQVAPQLGSVELVRKYLPNSIEMDPVKYWDLLD